MTAIAARLREHEPRDAEPRAAHDASAAGPSRAGLPKHTVNDVAPQAQRPCDLSPIAIQTGRRARWCPPHTPTRRRPPCSSAPAPSPSASPSPPRRSLPRVAVAKHGADDGPLTTSATTRAACATTAAAATTTAAQRARQARRRHLHRPLDRQAEGQARRRAPGDRVRGRPEPQRRAPGRSSSAATASSSSRRAPRRRRRAAPSRSSAGSPTRPAATASPRGPRARPARSAGPASPSNARVRDHTTPRSSTGDSEILRSTHSCTGRREPFPRLGEWCRVQARHQRHRRPMAGAGRCHQPATSPPLTTPGPPRERLTDARPRDRAPGRSTASACTASSSRCSS